MWHASQQTVVLGSPSRQLFLEDGGLARPWWWLILESSKTLRRTLDWQRPDLVGNVQRAAMEIPLVAGQHGASRHGEEAGMSPASILPAIMLGQSPALIWEEVASKEGMTTWPWWVRGRPNQHHQAFFWLHMRFTFQARTDCKVADNILIIGVHIPTNAGGPKCQQGPFRFNEWTVPVQKNNWVHSISRSARFTMANANLACQGQISLSLSIYICIYVVQIHAWGIFGDNNIGEPTSTMRYAAPSGDGQFPPIPHKRCGPGSWGDESDR